MGSRSYAAIIGWWSGAAGCWWRVCCGVRDAYGSGVALCDPPLFLIGWIGVLGCEQSDSGIERGYGC